MRFFIIVMISMGYVYSAEGGFSNPIDVDKGNDGNPKELADQLPNRLLALYNRLFPNDGLTRASEAEEKFFVNAWKVLDEDPNILPSLMVSYMKEHNMPFLKTPGGKDYKFPDNILRSLKKIKVLYDTNKLASDKKENIDSLLKEYNVETRPLLGAAYRSGKSLASTRKCDKSSSASEKSTRTYDKKGSTSEKSTRTYDKSSSASEKSTRTSERSDSAGVNSVAPARSAPPVAVQFVTHTFHNYPPCPQRLPSIGPLFGLRSAQRNNVYLEDSGYVFHNVSFSSPSELTSVKLTDGVYTNARVADIAPPSRRPIAKKQQKTKKTKSNGIAAKNARNDKNRINFLVH